AVLSGIPDEAVCQEGIRSLSDLLECERDLFRVAGSNDLLLEPAQGIKTAELRLEIGDPIRTFRRHRRIQLKWPPGHRRSNRRELCERALQPPLSDVAPGTDHIRIDVD